MVTAMKPQGFLIDPNIVYRIEIQTGPRHHWHEYMPMGRPFELGHRPSAEDEMQRIRERWAGHPDAAGNLKIRLIPFVQGQRQNAVAEVAL